MATRSFIGKRLPNGKIIGVYCHYDGYPTGVGRTLKEHYTDPAKVDSLIALGALSYLAPEVGERHDFNNPREGWTVAYARDRGDREVRQLTFSDVRSMKSGVANKLSAEYAYVMGRSGKWTTYKI